MYRSVYCSKWIKHGICFCFLYLFILLIQICRKETPKSHSESLLLRTNNARGTPRGALLACSRDPWSNASLLMELFFQKDCLSLVEIATRTLLHIHAFWTGFLTFFLTRFGAGTANPPVLLSSSLVCLSLVVYLLSLSPLVWDLTLTILAWMAQEMQ